MTLPKTTCLPSSQGVATVVMINWELWVLGPALAIDKYPKKKSFSVPAQQTYIPTDANMMI